MIYVLHLIRDEELTEPNPITPAITLLIIVMILLINELPKNLMPNHSFAREDLISGGF